MSEKGKAARKNQELRRAKRALRHAKARNRSPYIIKRISAHIRAVENGEKPQAIPERVTYRVLGKEARERQLAKNLEGEARKNREQGRVRVVGLVASASGEVEVP
jgi:hypothetical protein